MARRRNQPGISKVNLRRALSLAKRGLADLDVLIESLAADYVQAQMEITQKAAEALHSGRLGEFRYREQRRLEVQRVLKRVNAATPIKSRRVVKESYRLGKRISKTSGLDAPNDSAFSKVEQTAINLLTDNLTTQLEDSVRVVGRKVDDIYRHEGLRLATLQLTQEKPLEQAADDLIDRLRKQGITSFVDKANRQWKMDTYAQMVVRTVSSESVFQGTQASMLARDFDLVVVNKVNNPCPMCVKYDGNTYSLSGRETAQYPMLGIVFPIHPNCRHFITPSTEAFAERQRWYAQQVAA